MLELNELIEQTTPVEISFCGQTMNCKIRLNVVTKELVDSYKNQEDLSLKLLTKTIAEWDVSLNGQLLPINLESFKKLPNTLIDALSEEILSKRDELKKKNSKQSSDGSSPAVG